MFRIRKAKNIEVIEYFGGTYESAKSDERKQFQKMLTFVNRRKDISYIIVYSYDRFSRTGANGAYISDQLKTRYRNVFSNAGSRCHDSSWLFSTKPILHV